MNPIKNQQQAKQKQQQEFATVIEMLHKGVGLDDASYQGGINIGLDQLSGKIPYGVDFPEFATRKRLMLLGFVGQIFGTIIKMLIIPLVILAFSIMIWEVYPYLRWLLALVWLGVLAWWFLQIKRIIWLVKLIHTIKPIKQQFADPILRDDVRRMYNEAMLATKFAKDRTIMRVIGVCIMVISGGLLYYFFSQSPNFFRKFYKISPFLFMFGLSLLINPLSKAESLYLYGSSATPFKYIPMTSKLCWLVGIMASLWMIFYY